MGLRLLETLTSALYEDPIVLFREYVQNSVDAYKAAIRNDATLRMDNFCVEITHKAENRTIIFVDNGYGIESSQFIEKMRSIGDSDKGQYNDQIGFRGIGRLSAMPFCDVLTFENKVQGSSKVQVYQWEGLKYAELLKREKDQELSEAIDSISKSNEYEYEGNVNDHFFRVTINNYHEEISELLSTENFMNRLCTLLPLRYNPTFTEQEKIIQEYENFMKKDLNSFAYCVKFNGDILYKPYDNRHVLESDIIFWPLQFKPKAENLPAEKIGLLWFTFNRKVTANPTDEPRGILVRSKNMLVGGTDSLADAVTRNSGDYVATYRELTQTLSGVYGELLLDTPRLVDNARRDWFRIDAASIELRGIIAEFLRRLIAYRYAASKAFNDKESIKKKENLIKAYSELTQGIKQEKFFNAFYSKEDDTTKTEKDSFQYADDDLPRASISIKRFYDKTLDTLRAFYIEEDDLQTFFKVRAYLKKCLNEEKIN